MVSDGLPPLLFKRLQSSIAKPLALLFTQLFSAELFCYTINWYTVIDSLPEHVSGAGSERWAIVRKKNDEAGAERGAKKLSVSNHIRPKSNCNNRLEELYYIAFTRIVEGFFGYITHKPERIWMKPRVRCHGAHSHKIVQGKSPQGLHLRMPKRVLFLFFCHQYKVDFRPLILRWFWPLLK